MSISNLINIQLRINYRIDWRVNSRASGQISTSLLHLRHDKTKKLYVFQWYSRYLRTNTLKTLRFPLVFQVFSYKNIKHYTFSIGFLGFSTSQTFRHGTPPSSKPLRHSKTWKTIGKRIVFNVFTWKYVFSSLTTSKSAICKGPRPKRRGKKLTQT